VPAVQVIGFDHVVLRCADIEASLAFYCGELGLQPDRTTCDGAKGIVTEGQKLFKQTSDAPELLDCAIAGAASKVEHYEIATYRGMIQSADLMGQREIVSRRADRTLERSTYGDCLASARTHQVAVATMPTPAVNMSIWWEEWVNDCMRSAGDPADASRPTSGASSSPVAATRRNRMCG